MKTAAEMRELNPKYAARNIIREVEREIEKLARLGYSDIRFTAATSSTLRFSLVEDWIHTRENALLTTILSELREAGYLVTSVYNEGQFVDMDIIISWGSE